MVSVNLHRRHLDEFQRAEIAIKYNKLYKKIARDRWESSKFTTESGTEAINKRWEEEEPDDDAPAELDGGGDDSEIPPLSADRGRIGGHKGSVTTQELANEFGVSASTIDRVKTILEQGLGVCDEGSRRRANGKSSCYDTRCYSSLSRRLTD